MRLGWVTAAPALIEKIIYHMQGIHLGANSFTQAGSSFVDRKHTCLLSALLSSLPSERVAVLPPVH
jgi:DNA-binding transcriptional MocR family regulator